MNQPVNRAVLYALIVTLIAVIAVGINSVLYANYASDKAIARSNANIQKSEQIWCDLLVSMDNGYKHNPPTTQDGKAFALKIHDLRIKFHCQES